ncbi:MAG: AAA family ATPase [Acidimicrobiales bacterium]
MTWSNARFPFSAVVGQDEVKLALLLTALDPRIGGVLLRGQKGSAKSTLARALAALLPGDSPFVELPVGATEDRVVGTLDLEAALTGGHRRLRPGLLHAADGGVLYVDEVNLLPDHLVDVLLDVAASGVNRIERDGVSESHASRFVLIGSMNPEEGDLRPQLLDRFGLSVDVVASDDPGVRADAVRRRLDFDVDTTAFMSSWAGPEQDLATRLSSCRVASVPDALIDTISSLCARVGAEGLRADLVICRSAAALAGWEQRSQATVSDVRRVAPFALAHRRRRSPFDEPGIDQSEIDEILSEQPVPTDDERRGAGAADTKDPVAADAPTPVEVITTPRTVGDLPSGRRSEVEGRRGRLIGDRQPDGPIGGVAVMATVRAAASRRAEGVADEDAPLVVPGDLREAVHEHKAGNLLAFAVDVSGSMGAARRMEAAKGAVLSLLLDAYQRRDRVALVTFCNESADLILKPTGSVEVARSRLADLPTGGRTPLAQGIEKALSVCVASTGGYRPLLVLISDGRATFAPAGDDPLEAAMAAARNVRSRRVPAVVIDAEDGPARLGLSKVIADAMGARYLPLPELTAGAIEGALRRVMSS